MTRIPTHKSKRRLRDWRTITRCSALLSVTGFFVLSLLSLIVTPIVHAQASGQQQQLFNSAAQEFRIPVNILLSLSYNESHWQTPGGMSSDGGYGVMDLRAQQSHVISGKDGSTMAPIQQPSDYYTLNQAANLLHVSMQTLQTSTQQNIRGAAAVLAQDAKALNGGNLPSSTNGWYGALAKYSGAPDQQSAQSFAGDVFSTMKQGASLSMTNGQAMDLPATSTLTPNTSTMSKLNLPKTSAASSSSSTPAVPSLPANEKAECPSSLSCNFIPAAYGPDSSTDPTNYGNFDFAHRPQDMQIKYIFIHDTEGSYDSVVSEFQDPASYVSAQYLIRSSDGQVTQMVPNEDVSWGVYDWYDNMHGINIENEGYAAQGATWYTPVMYQHLATLVRYLAAEYNIPLNRQHILGHDNIPVLESADFVNQHWDPGPYWNWTYFMDLVHGKTLQQAAKDTGAVTVDNITSPIHAGSVITIDPNFATNQPIVTDCQTGTCTTLPPQGANFVYLYNEPSSSSPLLADPYLHSDGTAGTTADSDWGDKAPTGSQYVVAAVQGNWTAIWYAGQKAWFYNPKGSGATATTCTTSMIVTSKPGVSSVAVYGAAYPDASAYPSVIPVQQFNQLYTISAGQQYTTTGEVMPNDYFYDDTWNYSAPDDHRIVVGDKKYYQVMINHRIGYVKASDVIVR
jgi:N-acetyl-anhydromuramyl-L-alanine amidase AmpD